MAKGPARKYEIIPAREGERVVVKLSQSPIKTDEGEVTLSISGEKTGPTLTTEPVLAWRIPEKVTPKNGVYAMDDLKDLPVPVLHTVAVAPVDEFYVFDRIRLEFIADFGGRYKPRDLPGTEQEILTCLLELGVAHKRAMAALADEVETWKPEPSN